MTEPMFFHEIEAESGWSEIKQAMRNALTPEKFNRVLSFFSFPLPICSISNDIVEDLNRVFNGRNANFSIQYPNKRAEAQTNELLYRLNTRDWIEKEGRKVFKCQPQTIVVVDKDEKGVPFYVSVGVDKLVGYQTDDFDRFEFIIFEVEHTQHGQTILSSVARIGNDVGVVTVLRLLVLCGTLRSFSRCGICRSRL